jgi:hypothetical protein
LDNFFKKRISSFFFVWGNNSRKKSTVHVSCSHFIGVIPRAFRALEFLLDHQCMPRDVYQTMRILSLSLGRGFMWMWNLIGRSKSDTEFEWHAEYEIDSVAAHCSMAFWNLNSPYSRLIQPLIPSLTFILSTNTLVFCKHRLIFYTCQTCAYAF